jgi:branched-chain amino acid transport system ATP-binding protein
MLEIQHLYCQPLAETAVHDVSLRVSSGELVVLHGPNGAGKSTLCRCLAGLQAYDAGRIQVGGMLLPTAAWDIAGLGLIVLQKGRRVFPELTVEENLLLPVRASASGRAHARLQDALTLFPHLANRLRQLAGTLSGGEQQMVAVGRAVVSDPRVLVLDEPFLGLAPNVVGNLSAALAQLRATGVAVLATQAERTPLTAAADRTYAIAQGRLMPPAPPERQHDIHPRADDPVTVHHAS